MLSVCLAARARNEETHRNKEKGRGIEKGHETARHSKRGFLLRLYAAGTRMVNVRKQNTAESRCDVGRGVVTGENGARGMRYVMCEITITQPLMRSP